MNNAKGGEVKHLTAFYYILHRHKMQGETPSQCQIQQRQCQLGTTMIAKQKQRQSQYEPLIRV